MSPEGESFLHNLPDIYNYFWFCWCWLVICVDWCTCYVTCRTFSSIDNQFCRLLSNERTNGSAGIGIGCCRDSAARTGCQPDGKSLPRHSDVQLHKFDWCQPGTRTSVLDDVFSVFSCDVAVWCLGRQPSSSRWAGPIPESLSASCQISHQLY